MARVAALLVFAFAMTMTSSPAFAAPAADPAPVVSYAGVLRTFNPHLSLAQSKDMATHVLLLSSYYNLDPRLLVAIVGVESSWHAGAVSATGAQGLGQLMPATAGGLGVLAFDAYENLDGTARYLRRMMQQYAGLATETRTTRAIASYNAGPGAVARAGGVPPSAETRTYVARVLDLWHRLQGELPGGTFVAPAPARPAIARVVARPSFVGAGDKRPDSVADFTALEVRSLEAFTVATVAAAEIAPAPVPSAAVSVHEARGLHRWLMRTFARPAVAPPSRTMTLPVR